MSRKQLRHVLSAATLAFVSITQGVQADIQNPVWESPVAGTTSGIQTFRGHVSSTTGIQVTVRLLIPSVSATFSSQIPWGAERSDVAASGPDILVAGLTLRGINRPQWEAVAVLRASSD